LSVAEAEATGAEVVADSEAGVAGGVTFHMPDIKLLLSRGKFALILSL
jgi:hypothetical protein